MKISFPVNKADGSAYSTLDEVMTAVYGEPHGGWLIGGNTQWHGGIHVSSVAAAKNAQLTPALIAENKTVPLNCMASGEIVAYRINRDYLSGPYCGHALRHSSTFALVRSVHKPKADDASTWLTFYSLYLHLAPLADYPKTPCYRVKTGTSTLRLRRYRATDRGIPEGLKAGERQAEYAAPPAVDGKTVKAGDRLAVMRQAQFYLPGESVPHLFGQAKRIKEGLAAGETYWVSLSPEYVETNGEVPALLPAWMAVAVARGQFDSVVNLSGADLIKIEAGDPIGHLGACDSPTKPATQFVTEYFAHLEVLSVDPNLPAFLTNPQKLNSGRRYIRMLKGHSLHSDEGNGQFRDMGVKVQIEALLIRENTTPKKDQQGLEWFKVTEGGSWLSEQQVEQLSQHDLAKLGFLALEENAAGDVLKSTSESWMRQALEQIVEVTKKDPRMESGLLSQTYRHIVANMADEEKSSPKKLRQALHYPPAHIREAVSKLVVKHASEWSRYANSSAWQRCIGRLDSLEVAYTRKWLDDMAWMKQVEAFKDQETVWHMHPIVFISALSGEGECECVEGITEEQLKFISPLTAVSVIRTYTAPINDMFVRFGINKCISRAHAIAQMLHESGGFSLTTEGLAREAPLPSYAPYIGRGLMQITWEANYRAYGQFMNESFLGDSNSTKMAEIPHSVLSAGWYWTNFKGLLQFSDEDDFILCTAKINGGFNGYDDRLKYLNLALKSLGVEGCAALNNNGVYSLGDSKAYNNAKFSFAWGLWSDPGSRARGKRKDRAQAIVGYARFLEIYNSKESVRTDNRTTYYASGRKSLQAKEHAESRLIELEGMV